LTKLASNLKRSKRTVGKRIEDLHRRVLHMQKRPAPRRIGSRVVVSGNIVQNAVTPVELAPNSVTQDAIAPGAVTDTELAPGAGGADTVYSGTAPTSPSIGDLWFDSSDSLKLKRWDGTAWVSVRDLGIAAAQTTADSKNKVYRQTTEPTGETYAEGDLWFDTDDNNKIYRRTGTAWTAVQLGGEALANINANKITAGTIDASVITVSNINAGNISAGTIAAARITSASISAADINADRITAGRILAGDTEIGNNVGPGDGHHGISLSPNNFSNIFLRRASDGVYFFRVNEGGANSLTFDSSSGVLNVTGTINASAGSIGGWSIAPSSISSGGTTISSNGTITIGVNSDSALRMNSGSDITMYAAAGGTSSIYYYRDVFTTNQWDSQLSQSAAGNLIVYGNDFNNNFYPTFIVRSYAYNGAEVRSFDAATTTETFAVTRAWTTTSGFNTDLATSTQMLQFFKRNQNNANTGVGYIRATNTTTTPSFVAGSDERLKNDIEVYSTPLIKDIKNINVY
jgi:hypothetical protein